MLHTRLNACHVSMGPWSTHRPFTIFIIILLKSFYIVHHIHLCLCTPYVGLTHFLWQMIKPPLPPLPQEH